MKSPSITYAGVKCSHSLSSTCINRRASYDVVTSVAQEQKRCLGSAGPSLTRGSLETVHALYTQEWKAKRSALLGRTEFVGGDFFKAATLPSPAPTLRDVYMLRNVLHDWTDAKTTDILHSLRMTMGAHHDHDPMAA